MSSANTAKRSVAISGASSFTGFWIALAFKERGWDVHTLFSQSPETYQGIRSKRVEILSTCTRSYFGIKAENGSMSQWIQNSCTLPIDIWVHHFHWMHHFKTPDYDIKRAKEISLAPLADLVSSLQTARYKGILHSSTYFEQNGSGSSLPEANAYIESKRATRELLSELAGGHKLPISTIFIPNPIGPLDNEDRFFTRLMTSIKLDLPFQILNPEIKTTLIPVQQLANYYVAAAENLLLGKSEQIYPVGLTLTVAEWVKKLRAEYEERWKNYAEWQPENLQLLKNQGGLVATAELR